MPSIFHSILRYVSVKKCLDTKCSTALLSNALNMGKNESLITLIMHIPKQSLIAS